jgi:putative thioredoxin
VSTTVYDVDTAGFEAEVVERSREVPVVVDFWAAWCGPCRTLGPTLEAAVRARDGEVVLAKVDVDANQQLAASFRVQGIPAVKAFRDGEVVAEFTGAVNAAQVEAFLDEVVPSEADRLAALGAAQVDVDPEAAREAFEQALDADPDHRAAAIGLAELLVEEDPDRAGELVAPHRPDPRAEAVVTRIALGDAGDLEETMAAAQADPDDDEAMLAYGRSLIAAGHHDEAIEVLLHAIGLRGAHRDDARQLLVDLFGLLGDDDPRVRAARPRLATALF